MSAHTTTEAVREVSEYLWAVAAEVSEHAGCAVTNHGQVLVAADRVARALAGLQACVISDAEKSGVVRRCGARNTAAWVESVTGESRRDAYSKKDIAEAVTKTPSMGQGLLDGSLNAAQVEQIAKTAEITKASAHRIEEFIEDVKGLSVKDTQRLARELERELATETPGERLDQQRRKRRASMGTKTDGSGMFELHAQFDSITGERIRLQLVRVLKNLHEGDSEQRSHKQILADALEQLITNNSAAANSNSNTGAGVNGSAGGGVDVIVTVTLKDLIAGLNATGSIVGTDQTIPVQEIRRMACEQGVIPAVLATTGEILDMGRKARLATGAQKRALKTRYGGCGINGCEACFEYCDIHHIWQWLKGGPTSLANLIPLCSHHHHHLIHDQGWTLIQDLDGTTTLKPP